MFRRLLAGLMGQLAKQPAAPDAPFIPIRDAAGNVTGMMDHLTAAYLESTAPDPSQRDLDTMLNRVTRVRVLNDGTSDGKALGSELLLECDDQPSLDALRACFAIYEDPRTFGHCMCLGDTAIECYRGQQLLATLGLHHGRSIRWDEWKHDAQLRDGQALLTWLAERGVSGPLDDFQAAQQRAAEAERVAQRWYGAMPTSLQPFWGDMQGFSVDLEPLRRALRTEFPDEIAYARALFAWYGSGKGPWSGFPMYEGVAESLLLELPTARLIEALTEQPATLAHLEGGARYFAGWAFRKQKPDELGQLPGELKQRLLAHSLMSSNPDTIQRAKSAFA